MHYYQLNIGDYAKSTAHLSLFEDLAYRRLLDLYYDTEKPLCADIDKLCRLIRMTEQKKETQQILEEYFSLTQKGWIQKRVQKELGAYSAKADASRANGKMGGRPKKTQQVNLANLDLTQEKAKQETLNTKHKPLTKERESTEITVKVANAPALKNTKSLALPMEWVLPANYGKWALENTAFTVEQIKNEGERFRDYWVNISGTKGKKKDWLATWRNWMKRAVEYEAKNNGKTWNEKRDDYENEKAKKRYDGLINATPEELKAIGFL